MISMAHIINPVLVGPHSDLYVAQPVTFETMRRARDYARGSFTVELFTAQFPEDAAIAPSGFVATPYLTRAVTDVAQFRRSRRLPLLRDILARLYEATAADVLIYTNVDIALQAHFYAAVGALLTEGYDALVINRRTIPGTYRRVAEIPSMAAEIGQSHRGWDCFIFRRAAFPKFRMGDVCIGATRSGLALLANMQATAANFREFRDLHLTFHIGDERHWLNPAYADYDAHNTRQLLKVLNWLQSQYGPFPADTIPGTFLRRRRLGPVYEWWARNVYLPPGVSQWLNRLAGRR